MSSLTDKAAYIRGLAEGMKLDTASNEGKLFSVIIEALGEIADAVDEIEEAQDELSEYVDSIDEDLNEIEEQFDAIFGEDDEDDDDDFDDDDYEDDDDEHDDDCDCAFCEGCETVYIECACPKCKAAFLIDEADEDTDVKYICPACGEKIRPNVDYEQDLPVAERADTKK